MIYDNFYVKYRKMIFTKNDVIDFDNAKICHIREKEFKTKGKEDKNYWMQKKVRDHCHFTGKYCGATHYHCNLMCEKPRLLPVIIHNL